MLWLSMYDIFYSHWNSIKFEKMFWILFCKTVSGNNSRKKKSTFSPLTMLNSLLLGHNKLWESFQETGIPDHLICLLRNLYSGQEVTVRTGHGTMDWFQTGKRVHQGCILSSCLFNIYAEYIVWNARLYEA